VTVEIEIALTKK